MRNLLVIAGVLLAACGSKKDSKDGAGASASPSSPATSKAGKHNRPGGLITNTEGAEICAALLPETLRSGFTVKGGGQEDALTCNLYSADKKLQSAAMNCKAGQSLDSFNAEKAAKNGEDVPGIGRGAYKSASMLVYFATNVACTVTIYNFDPAADSATFAKGVDAVLTPMTTPWPPR